MPLSWRHDKQTPVRPERPILGPLRASGDLLRLVGAVAPAAESLGGPSTQRSYVERPHACGLMTSMSNGADGPGPISWNSEGSDYLDERARRCRDRR